MRNMRITVIGKSGQRSTFELTIGSGMVVEVTHLPNPIGEGNPTEWERFMDVIFKEIYAFYRCDVRDLLDWRDTFIKTNHGRCDLLNINFYEG